MNMLDLVVVAVIVLSGLLAFSRGFVKEALSVVAWIGAVLAALYALPFATPVAEKLLPKGPVAQGAAAIIIFLAAVVVLSMLTSAVSHRVKQSSLSAVDRTLGLIFGLVRGVVLVCLGYIALSWALPADAQRPAWIAEARTLPLLATGADRLRALVPAGYRAQAAAADIETRRAAEQLRQLKEAAGAIGAFSTPRPGGTQGGAPSPTYTPEDKRDLNRLIQQQQESQ
jgi:membrane protein required for colicin V production